LSKIDRIWKEPNGGQALVVPISCVSCDLAQKFELKAGSMVALCKNIECVRFSKPISFKYFAELTPSDKINEDLLGFVKDKVAERIGHERQRQIKRMKRADEKEMDPVAEATQIPDSTTENARMLQNGSQTQFDKLDIDFRQINDYFESKFEWIRKRLVKAKELKTNEQADPKPGAKPDARGWDQLIGKYRKLLKIDEPKVDNLYEKASAIDKVLETRIKQVDAELPINECELRVEQDLKEDAKNVEELQKQVDILRKQQEECLPRKEMVRNLLERIQYCATEIKGAEQESILESIK
jgi:hypothetical protein